MSVDIRNYLVYGIKVDGYDDTICEKYYDSDNEPYKGIILDGMNGDYMVFGKVLFDSGDVRHGDIIDSFKVIEQDTFEQLEKNFREDFAEKFPELLYVIDDKPFKLLAFTHYS